MVDFGLGSGVVVPGVTALLWHEAFLHFPKSASQQHLTLLYRDVHLELLELLYVSIKPY